MSTLMSNIFNFKLGMHLNIFNFKLGMHLELAFGLKATHQ